MSRRLPVASSAAVRRRFGELAREHRRVLTWVTVVQVVSALAAVAVPRVLGALVDMVRSGAGRADVARVVVVLAVLALAHALLAGVGEYGARVLGERVFASLREHLVSTVIHLPLSAVEAAGTGDLLGRTTHDLGRLQYLVQRGVSQILVIVLTVLSVFLAAVLTSPLLSPALLLPALLLVPVLRWYLPRAVPAYRTEGALWAVVEATVAETAEQAVTVDALGLGRLRARVFDHRLTQVWSVERYTMWLRIWMMGAVTAVLLSPVVAVVAWGAWLMGRGQATLGAVTTLALYAFSLREPLSQATFWLDLVQSASAAMARVVGVDLVEPDRPPAVGTGGQAVGQAVRLRHVRYSYVAGHEVLHDVSLDLVPGERLAVVGPSGAGKSTLGRMLAGIHPPTSGSVSVGGTELTALSEADLHRQVVLVTQEHHVFAASLADNLRLARPGATDAELRRALDAVGALEWVTGLGDGLDTGVGSGGLTLTPGQAQQVALARVVLMDPAMVVLDEATSLMDPASAQEAEHVLDAVLRGRTVVAIAHRLRTAADADRVAVVMDGRVVELGSHDQLVALGGHYASLWRSWQSG